LVLDNLDDTIHTPDQAELAACLPAVGVIPLSSGARHALAVRKKHRGPLKLPAAVTDGVEMISHTNPNSQISESYRAMRTSVLLARLGAPPKVILVTSALPQDGKTTTAVNTAIVLAQRGAPVLLVDADLRRPSIHKILQVSGKSGLSTLLTGGATADQELIIKTSVPNLFVLPAGSPPPHPSELLGSTLMKDFLQRWREDFAHVVIDTPPALSVTDAIVLSVEADSVLVVARFARTKKAALRRARELLQQVNANCTGVVLNAMNFDSPESYYYGYYGSKNGGDYYHNDT
jgi:capsular exopolysaccharide synthesis family protein